MQGQQLKSQLQKMHSINIINYFANKQKHKGNSHNTNNDNNNSFNFGEIHWPHSVLNYDLRAFVSLFFLAVFQPHFIYICCIFYCCTKQKKKVPRYDAILHNIATQKWKHYYSVQGLEGILIFCHNSFDQRFNRRKIFWYWVSWKWPQDRNKIS